jgi:hypothetical protein
MSQLLPVIDPTTLSAFIFAEDKAFELYPTNKPPVCFRGFKVHEFTDDTMGSEECIYAMYITNRGTLIMSYVTVNYATYENSPDGDPTELKLKKFENLNDVWTFFKFIHPDYTNFLSACAKKLENPTLFWLKVE